MLTFNLKNSLFLFSLFVLFLLPGCAKYPNEIAQENGQSGNTAQKNLTNWTAFLRKFRHDDSVTQLIFVQYCGNSKADICFYTKNKKQHDSWTLLLETKGFLGENGIDKIKEGDRKTPTGNFGILELFGIKPNPGTKLPYIDVTEDLYMSGEKENYNRFVRSSKTADFPNSEHIIDYSPEYNYALNLDYNKECLYGLGSAIFFHVKGAKNYTAGCIAVSEESMKTILKNIDSGARVLIYPK